MHLGNTCIWYWIRRTTWCRLEDTAAQDLIIPSAILRSKTTPAPQIHEESVEIDLALDRAPAFDAVE
jgi:hypothetical protein